MDPKKVNILQKHVIESQRLDKEIAYVTVEADVNEYADIGNQSVIIDIWMSVLISEA